MFKELPFTWGFMTVIIARAEKKLPSVWLFLLQGAVQKPCHLSHRTETLWRKTNVFLFFVFLKKKLLNCLEKSDSDLQKSFLLDCLATGRRGQMNIIECLSGSSGWALKMIPCSPNIMVKVRSIHPFSLSHEEYLCCTSSPHPAEHEHEVTEQHWLTCYGSFSLTHLLQQLLTMPLGILRHYQPVLNLPASTWPPIYTYAQICTSVFPYVSVCVNIYIHVNILPW